MGDALCKGSWVIHRFPQGGLSLFIPLHYVSLLSLLWGVCACVFWEGSHNSTSNVLTFCEVGESGSQILLALLESTLGQFPLSDLRSSVSPRAQRVAAGHSQRFISASEPRVSHL